jgi:prepilin-type N-terminal cleavage/methylation domain-containing protein
MNHPAPAGDPVLPRRVRAFSLIEVMFGVVIVGVLVVALYSALASAVPMVRSCQENEHVTQILSEKLDTIRLYNWIQLTNRTDAFLPTNFIVGIEPMDPNSMPYYTGTISIAQAPITETYRSNLLQVTVRVDWVSGSRPQSQSMFTYVCKYGLQSYITR